MTSLLTTRQLNRAMKLIRQSAINGCATYIETIPNSGYNPHILVQEGDYRVRYEISWHRGRLSVRHRPLSGVSSNEGWD